MHTHTHTHTHVPTASPSHCSVFHCLQCLPTETIERGKSVNITTCALIESHSAFSVISRTPKLDFTMTMHMDGVEWQGRLTVEGREDKADQFVVQHNKEEKVSIAMNIVMGL